MPTFVKQIFAVIKRCGSAESELAQTAIKSLAVIIRDCKSAELKEQQLTYLLGIIGPDLEEPDRQAALFTLLRAILSRRFVVPEIYDLMEKVSAIMVTSQSAHVQELCRSALIQFLLDYPQGKGRLRAQMTFLAQNLSYVYESGRVSVMELLAAVFSKFSENLVQDYADLFFLALVMVTVNDDAEKCRAMAGELLKQLLKFYDGDRLEDLLEMLSQWTSNATDNPALARAAMIVAGLLLQATSEPEPSLVSRLVNQVNVVIKLSATALREAEATEPDSPFAPELHMDFALPHQALIALARCLDADKMAYISVNWSDLLSLLLFPHDWVRLASARSIVRLLSAQDVVLGGSGQKRKSKVDVILSPSGLLDLARKSCILLSSRNSKGAERYVPSEALCSEVVKILFSIGQRWTVSYCLGGVFADDWY
jgi:U3 small nucleolar RNA-associated protein 20